MTRRCLPLPRGLRNLLEMRDLLANLSWRGLLYDATPSLAERLERGPIVGYVGFDPTAPSLQVGNLVPVMLLTHLQRAGGKPIVLMGGGTGMIGDPSGKQTERPLLTADEIDRNVVAQRRQLERFLDFTGPNAALLLDNADWLRQLRLVDFLRDTGKHFTVSYMLQKESVKTRLEGGISYAEFSYMLLQAYDFLQLFQSERCELQMGGSDQWGNITAGVELVRRAAGGEAHGLSAPLITKASGAKFGKSEEGSIWLDPHLTSPYAFFQFWINADDADVESFLKRFTLRSAQEIADIMERHRGAPDTRVAQQELALDVTTRVHGATVTNRVVSASQILFGQSDLTRADPETWDMLARELRGWTTSRHLFPRPIVDLLADSGLTSSKGDARRQLQQGGISLNGARVALDATVTLDQLLADRFLWLRRGKKTDLIVRVDP
jgi:tyrosyl-tRNA synthetase